MDRHRTDFQLLLGRFPYPVTFQWIQYVIFFLQIGKKPCWPTFYLNNVAPNTSAVDWWVPKNRHGSRKLSQKQRRRVLGRIGPTANPLSGNVQLFFTILHNISSHSDTKAEGIFRHIRWMAQIKLSMHRKMFPAPLGDFSDHTRISR